MQTFDLFLVTPVSIYIGVVFFNKVVRIRCKLTLSLSTPSFWVLFPRYSGNCVLDQFVCRQAPALMKVKEESEKAGLKLNIQKTKIMASSPITSWQIDGETMETVRDFIFGAPESLQMVTAAMKLKDACSWKKSYDQPRRHIKKQTLLCQQRSI